MSESVTISCHLFLKESFEYVWSTAPYNSDIHIILNDYQNKIFQFDIPYSAVDVEKFLERLSK